MVKKAIAENARRHKRSVDILNLWPEIQWDPDEKTLKILDEFITIDKPSDIEDCPLSRKAYNFIASYLAAPNDLTTAELQIKVNELNRGKK